MNKIDRRTYIPASLTLPAEVADLLFLQWVQHYAKERLGIGAFQSNSDVCGRATTYNITADGAVGIFITLGQTGSPGTIEGKGIDQAVLEVIIQDALARVAEDDTGEDLCFKASFEGQSLGKLDQTFFTQLMRTLSDQVWIEGKRRIGKHVILHFVSPRPNPANNLFVPKTTITAYIFVPGPCSGPLSEPLARRFKQIASAICAFALGFPVDMFPVMYPAPLDEATQAFNDRSDMSIDTLARNSVGLDVFGATGGIFPEFIHRVSSSLIAYEASMRQVHSEVSIILLVGAMEALTVPNTSWKLDRAVARFQNAILALCPDALDAIIVHPNMEKALGIIKGKKKNNKLRQLVLDRIYELRSNPVHGGLSVNGQSFSLASSDGIVVSLLSDLYRAMFLAFLQSPRSFLIGHPKIFPSSVADI